MFKEFILGLLRREPGWVGDDRRLTLRARVDFELEVAMPGLRYLGKTLDASPRGIRLRIRGPWKPSVVKRGQTAQLKFLTPMFGAELDTVQCQVRWVKKEAENLFLLGLTFDDTIENLQRSWVKPVLLKGLSQKIAQQRKTLRVRCRLPASLTVEGKSFEGSLLDLSTGGVRVESFETFSEGTPMTVEVKCDPLGPLKLQGVIKRILKPYGTFTYGLKLHPDQPHAKQLMAYINHFHALNKKSQL